MAAKRPPFRVQFRGIARTLWVALVLLMTAMLVDAWFRPPPEGFTAYLRKIMLVLIVCFVLSPLISTGVVSLVAWAKKDSDPPY